MPDDPGTDPGHDNGPDGRDGRRRLRDALLARPGRAQVLVGVLLAALGFGAVVQVRSIDTDDDFGGARRSDLVTLVDTLDDAELRAQSQLADLTETRDELESAGEDTLLAEREAQEQADTLAILTGTVPVSGPGVVLTIDDPDVAIGATALLNVVEELRDAGAEAIAVNDSVRVVAQSYFVDSDTGVLVDGTEVTRPYVTTVIGDPDTLATAVTFRGGLIDTVELLGGSVRVEPSDDLRITALSDTRDPTYAQPTS